MQTTTAKQANPLLKAIRDAFKKGRNAYIHGRRSGSEPWRRDVWTFDLTVEQGYMMTNAPKVTISEIPGRVANGYTDAVEMRTPSEGRPYERYTDTYEPARGYWGFLSEVKDVILSLPLHAELSFEVALDSHTNECLTRTRMHGDSVSLRATWTERGQKVERRFLLAVACGPHNSARFGNYSD